MESNILSELDDGSDRPVGGIIEQCGEQFRIRENYGRSGEVEKAEQE